MSFLDKLGDFAGGFAEGAAETFIPLYTRNMERQYERGQMLEKREYQERLLGESREYAREEEKEQREYEGRLRLLGELGQTRNLQGLADEFGEDDPLYDEAQSQIRFIVDNIHQKSEQSFRLADVALDFSKSLESQNYRQLQAGGTNAETFQDIVGQLEGTKENILAVMEDPNFEYGADDKTIALYNERLDDIERQLEKVNAHSSGYNKYLMGREDYDATVEIALKNENYDYAIQLMNQQGGTYYTPSVQQARISSAMREKILNALKVGDVDQAYVFAGDSPTLNNIVSEHESIQAGEITTLDIEGARDYGTLTRVYDDLLKNPNIGESKKELLIRNIKNKFSSMAIESKSRVSQTILAQAKIHMQGGRFTNFLEAMNKAIRDIENNPTAFGIEKWMVDRFEWDRSLELQIPVGTADNLPDRMAKQYTGLIDAGAYGKDEVLGFLGDIKFLSSWERDRVAQQIHTHEPKFTESAMMGLGGMLNAFELTDLPGFSQLDEMTVKSMAKNAAVATEGKRNKLKNALKVKIGDGVTNAEIRDEAIRRVDELFNALSLYWPDLSFDKEKEAEKEKEEKRIATGRGRGRIQAGASPSGGRGRSGSGNSLTDKSFDHLEGVKTRPSNVQSVTTL